MKRPRRPHFTLEFPHFSQRQTLMRCPQPQALFTSYQIFTCFTRPIVYHKPVTAILQKPVQDMSSRYFADIKRGCNVSKMLKPFLLLFSGNVSCQTSNIDLCSVSQKLAHKSFNQQNLSIPGARSFQVKSTQPS